MNFTVWLQTHRRSILFLLAILAIGGVIAAFELPVTLFPDVSFPRVAVELDSGDRTADQMVTLVTRPVEEAIRHVPGVLNLSSTSSRGSAEIKVDFGWGHDMAAATLEVQSAVTQILPTLACRNDRRNQADGPDGRSGDLLQSLVGQAVADAAL